MSLYTPKKSGMYPITWRTASASRTTSCPRMRAVPADEKHFLLFMAFDFDQVGGGRTPIPGFKTGPQDTPVRACVRCHAGLGLGSVNSLGFFTHEIPLPHLTAPGEERDADSTARWKEGRAEWGGLKMLWPAASRP